MNSVSSPIITTTAARYGIYVADVMDTYTANPRNLTPSMQSTYSLAEDWCAIAYLVANDTYFLKKAALGVKPEDYVYYGVLAQSKSTPQEFILVIRGTSGFLEWVVDAHVGMVPFGSKDCGNVEGGFFQLYKSMKLLKKDEHPTAVRENAWQRIRSLLPANSQDDKLRITIVGHSLGAALACFTTLDFCTRAKLGDAVTGCFFACPRPGDADFASAFDKEVQSYTVYDYVADVVPNLPPNYPPLPTQFPPIVPSIPGPTGDSFVSLPQIYALDCNNSQAHILDNPKSNHHVLCYSAMLHYKAQADLFAWWRLLMRDGDFPLSIRGPTKCA